MRSECRSLEQADRLGWRTASALVGCLGLFTVSLLSLAALAGGCGDAYNALGSREGEDAGDTDAEPQAEDAGSESSSDPVDAGAKYVFVSSALFTGNLGGLEGADAKCQALAASAGLAGAFRAWLSDSTGSPATRFTRSAGPYLLLNGTIVANDWAQLTSGTLAHVIDRTELNVLATPTAAPSDGAAPSILYVWTNTLENGKIDNLSAHCSDWSLASPSVYGNRGYIPSVDYGWTTGTNGPCQLTSALYCVGQ